MQEWAADSADFLSALAVPTLLTLLGDFRTAGLQLTLLQRERGKFNLSTVMSRFDLSSIDQSHPAMSLRPYARSSILGEKRLLIRYNGLVLHVLVPIYWSAASKMDQGGWSRVLDLWLCFLSSTDSPFLTKMSRLA